MKVTLAQINTTPNDFEGNFNKITTGILNGKADGADVVVFPELSIPGYLVKDLVYGHNFVEKNLMYLNKIAEYSKKYNNLNVVVGYIDNNTTGVGKPFKNMAAVIKNGNIIATYQKQLLPFYDVFDESRYFEAGKDLCVVDINGTKVGLLICEDLWNDKGQDDYLYKNNPVERYREAGIKTIISINSSPYAKNKPEFRSNMLGKIAEDGNMTIIYVNQIGGNDELVFDGQSCVVHSCFRRFKIANRFKNLGEDEFVTVDIDKTKDNSADLNNGYRDHLKMTILGLKDYIKKSGFKQVVLGSSGGIDSAVVAALASLAIGPENVNCIMMPSIYSSEGSVKDAKELHKNLGCKEYLVPIDHERFLNPIIDAFGFKSLPYIEKNGNYNKVADENIQARMRGQIVMHYSNATGALALTTGNKTELAVGYFTIGGDGLGGFNPIGDLHKMEVYEIARQINELYGREVIPLAIINKAPSAELAPGQTDEASLLPYPILDRICELYIEEYITTHDEFVKVYKDHVVSEKDYNRIARLIYVTEFKRRIVPPCTKLRKIAFGTGRRYPIVKK